MSAKGRRKPEPEEHENHERWAVSYADMMTVLLGLFIVLFAISQVDVDKYMQLRNSLAISFGQPAISVLDGGMGAIAGAATVSDRSEVLEEADLAGRMFVAATGTEDLVLARHEVSRLEGIAEAIRSSLAEQGLDAQVRFKIDQRGLIIGLVADELFFAGGSADLTPAAEHILDSAVGVLRDLPDEISVQGHANTIPISGRYATNWELSADRATRVLRRLVEQGGVDPGRISAQGFGDARPEFDYTDPDAVVKNRRVDLVVVSSLPDDIRELLPMAADDLAGA